MEMDLAKRSRISKMSKIDRFFDRMDAWYESMMEWLKLMLSFVVVFSVFGFLLWYGITNA
tara:strand:- start:1411 stop:1590 length:180 start_codon:yes stop_codon:yes gene_type:complete